MEARKGRPLRANRGKNPNARWIVDEPVNKPKPTKRRKSGSGRPKKAKVEEEPITEGETRCRCEGKVSDDKTMAECENCATWQHVVCEFGVNDESAVPEPYHCYQCRKDDDVKEDVKDDVKDEINDSKNVSEETTKESPGKEASEQASEEASEDASKEASEESNGETSGETNDETNGDASGIGSLKDKARKSVANSWLKILKGIKAETQVKDLDQKALALEAALFDAFGENDPKQVGPAYREQFRTLSFNLKDEKNTRLQRAVYSGAIEPATFVRMSSRELQNPELKQKTEELQQESIRESIIKEDEPPMEVISTNTAEVNVEPSYVALEKEDKQDELEQDQAMKEPLGPPPPLQVSTTSASSTGGGVEQPVWTGSVRLSDGSLQFAAKGINLSGAHTFTPENWTEYIGEAISVQGLVQASKAFEYFNASAAEDKHELGAFAIDAADNHTSSELYDYLHTKDRVGSVHIESRPDAKDAYLLPWDGTTLPYLRLEGQSMQLLEHLKAEHDNEKVLMVVYVFNKLH